MKKYVEFIHVTQRSWEMNAETITKKIDTLQTSGYKVISVSFSSAMVACIFYRKIIWKAIKDSFNIPYWE